jgi:ankyrin repeat protein
MPAILGPKTNLETLRKDAKRWLKALRAGDPASMERLHTAWPKAPPAPSLRDVQHAIAREYGLGGWAGLREAIADRDMAARSRDDLATEVLRAAWDAGDRAAAARIAAKHPELAHYNIHAAVAFGDLEEVRRRLAADPSAALAKAGPLDWEPLQYLAYSRLPLPAVADNALVLATLLLDHGADPNAEFNDGWDNPFKVLTGVIGLGEGVRPPHPRDRELAELLVARGADPFDTQALYNDSIVADDTHWLDFLFRHSDAQGQAARWTSLGEKALGGGKRNTVDYLLGNAVNQNHLKRAEWLLLHGADPNGRNAYSQNPHHELAQLKGLIAMTDLLERYGARPVPISREAAFHVACMRLDEAVARNLAVAHPAYLQDPGPLLIAAGQNRTDVIRLALDLGVPVDLPAPNGMRALHYAAQAGAIGAIGMLIDAGADIDRRGGDYEATPLGYGVFWKNPAVIDLLAPLSRDVHGLTASARLDRLRALLDAEPALANARNPRGLTPLFALPDDEEAAAEAAALLLEKGTNPAATGADGETADRTAAKRGLDEAAEFIREAKGNG